MAIKQAVYCLFLLVIYNIILLLIIEEFYTMHPITLSSCYGILVEDVFLSFMLWNRFI